MSPSSARSTGPKSSPATRTAEFERHYVLIVFAGRPIGGEVNAGDDAAEARFVPISDFARLNLTEDTRRILAGGKPL